MTQRDARLPQAAVSLADYTTWRVGGLAEWLAEPGSLEETQAWIAWASQQGMPCRIIGAGSNLLIHDDGLPGLSLCLRKLQGLELDATTGTVEVLAGEPIPSLARRAARAGLHGLEWSVGIPNRWRCGCDNRAQEAAHGMAGVGAGHAHGRGQLL